MDGLTKGNPAAQRIFDVPANQDIIGSALYPSVVSPVKAQRAQTLQDVNVLLEQAGMPQENQDGSIGVKLPVEPSILWDYSIVIPTIQEFMIENADLRVKNPLGWGQVERYYGMCQDMQTTQGVRKSQLELKVRAASQPPPQQNPAELGAQAALELCKSNGDGRPRGRDRCTCSATAGAEWKSGSAGLGGETRIVKTALGTLKVAGGAEVKTGEKSMRKISEIQFDRVVYAVGGVEYDAIALGTPQRGVHGGFKMVSDHLSLIYLNERGEPIKITGAPLLVAAAISLGLVREYAEASAAANYRPGAQRDGQANVYEADARIRARSVGGHSINSERCSGCSRIRT